MSDLQWAEGVINGAQEKGERERERGKKEKRESGTEGEDREKRKRESQGAREHYREGKKN